MLTPSFDQEILSKLYERENSLINIIETSQTQLEAIRQAILGFGGKVNSKASNVQSLIIPTEYKTELTWTEKILFVLAKIGKGYVTDIHKELMSIDSTLDSKRAFNAITHHCSQLKSKKKLKHKEIAGKFEYYLPL